MPNEVFCIVLGAIIVCIAWFIDRNRYTKMYKDLEQSNSNLLTTLYDVYVFLSDPIKENYRLYDIRREIDNLVHWNNIKKKKH